MHSHEDGLHFGWVVLAATFYINLIVDGYCFAFGIIRLYLEQDYPDYPAWMVSIIGGLVPTVYSFFAPVCIAANEFLGSTRVIICASLLSTVAFLLAWANTFLQLGFYFDLFMLGIVQGISSALLYAPSIAVIVQYFPIHQRSLAAGITTCGSPVGAMVYSIIIPPLVEKYSWRGSLAIFAGLTLNGCLCALAFLKSLKQRRKRPRQLQHFHEHDQLHAPEAVPLEPLPSIPTPPALDGECINGESHGHFRPPDDRDGVPIPHCYILQKILEDKLRNRLDTNHSLDNAIITLDNVLIRASPQNQQAVSQGKGYVTSKKTRDADEKKPETSPDAAAEGSQQVEPYQPAPSPTLVEVLKRYFNAKLIFQPSFMCLLGAGAVSVIGYYIPPLLIIAQSQNPIYGVSETVRSNLLMLFGIFNALGRVVSGRLGDLGIKYAICTSFWIYIIGNFASGLLLLIFPHFMFVGDNAFIWFVLFYAFFIAPFVTMRSVIVTEMYGEENVNETFGWFISAQGAVQILGFILPSLFTFPTTIFSKKETFFSVRIAWLDSLSPLYAYGFGAACFFLTCTLTFCTYKPYFKARRELIFQEQIAKSKAHRAYAALQRKYRV